MRHCEAPITPRHSASDAATSKTFWKGVSGKTGWCAWLLTVCGAGQVLYGGHSREQGEQWGKPNQDDRAEGNCRVGCCELLAGFHSHCHLVLLILWLAHAHWHVATKYLKNISSNLCFPKILQDSKHGYMCWSTEIISFGWNLCEASCRGR